MQEDINSFKSSFEDNDVTKSRYQRKTVVHLQHTTPQVTSEKENNHESTCSSTAGMTKRFATELQEPAMGDVTAKQLPNHTPASSSRRHSDVGGKQTAVLSAATYVFSCTYI